MSSWQQDDETMQALDDWLQSQQKPLNTFMEHIMAYAGEETHWALLVVYGKFVMFYNQLIDSGDCSIQEAFAQALANIANDPLTQQIVGQMIGGMMNRKVGLE
tara:strand:- start:246 stop:554 length:309 start_codon:yes stop_codon:yes gene_type:complete